MKFYVVTAPEEIRGIYETWEECQAAVAGVAGARHQAVSSRAKAEAMLRGQGTVLPAGTYAFTDGNAQGGVGIVLVEQGSDGPVAVHETSTSVQDVFADGNVPGLETPQAVRDALLDIRQVLAEMAALYQVLRTAPMDGRLTVVHDYTGVSEWMEGRWKARKPMVAALVGACRGQLRDRRLSVTFQYQEAHQSEAAGLDDFVKWNTRADKLAAQASRDNLG